MADCLLDPTQEAASAVTSHRLRPDILRTRNRCSGSFGLLTPSGDCLCSDLTFGQVKEILGLELTNGQLPRLEAPGRPV